MIAIITLHIVLRCIYSEHIQRYNQILEVVQYDNIYGKVLDIDENKIYIKILKSTNEEMCIMEQKTILLYESSRQKIPTYLQHYTQIKVKISYQKIPDIRNDGEFSMKNYYFENGIDGIGYMQSSLQIEKEAKGIEKFIGKYKQWQYRFKEKQKSILFASLPENYAGIMYGMLFGDRKYIEEEDIEAYKKAGVIHILAISGLHVSLISLLLYHILSLFSIKKEHRFYIQFLFLVLYASLVGFMASVVRASLMILVFQYSIAFELYYHKWRALLISAILYLLCNIRHLVSVGFLLSYGSVLSIFYIFPIFQVKIKNKFCHRIMNMAILSMAITIGTLPISLYFFYGLSIGGVFANVLLIPMVPFLFFFTILGLFIGSLSLPLAKLLMGVSYCILEIFSVITKYIESIGGYIWYGKMHLIFCVLYIGICSIYILKEVHLKYKGKKIVFLLLLAMVVFINREYARNGSCLYLFDTKNMSVVFLEHEEKWYFIDVGVEEKYDDKDKKIYMNFCHKKGISDIEGVILPNREVKDMEIEKWFEDIKIHNIQTKKEKKNTYMQIEVKDNNISFMSEKEYHRWEKKGKSTLVKEEKIDVLILNKKGKENELKIRINPNQTEKSFLYTTKKCGMIECKILLDKIKIKTYVKED